MLSGILYITYIAFGAYLLEMAAGYLATQTLGST